MFVSMPDSSCAQMTSLSLRKNGCKNCCDHNIIVYVYSYNTQVKVIIFFLHEIKCPFNCYIPLKTGVQLTIHRSKLCQCLQNKALKTVKKYSVYQNESAKSLFILYFGKLLIWYTCRYLKIAIKLDFWQHII
jgi:hypothetical protein